MENKKEEVTKLTLNVLIADGTEPILYLNYLRQQYNVNVVKIENVKSSSQVDLVLFTGGEDVNPAYYDEAVGQYTQFNDKRDKLERSVYSKLQSVPKLGICRGAQFLTVMAGGKLVQHVTNHGSSHEITVRGYGNFEMTSTHHQMMYPFDMKESSYNLVGWATKFKSTTYLNGNNKEIETPITFLEPEIVEYVNARSLCIQGHPEFASEQARDITLSLILSFLKRLSKKPEQFERSWMTEAVEKVKLRVAETYGDADLEYGDYDDYEERAEEQPRVSTREGRKGMSEPVTGKYTMYDIKDIDMRTMTGTVGTSPRIITYLDENGNVAMKNI